jgi:hypothetical protein
MTASQTVHSDLSDDMVIRVGSAAGRVARIQQDFTMQAQEESDQNARENLASKARADAEQAISDHGLSVQQYNAVLTAAENDEDLEQRLVDAARSTL